VGFGRLLLAPCPKPQVTNAMRSRSGYSISACRMRSQPRDPDAWRSTREEEGWIMSKLAVGFALVACTVFFNALGQNKVDSCPITDADFGDITSMTTLPDP
jgi:hypothetical protein